MSEATSCTHGHGAWVNSGRQCVVCGGEGLEWSTAQNAPPSPPQGAQAVLPKAPPVPQAASPAGLWVDGVRASKIATCSTRAALGVVLGYREHQMPPAPRAGIDLHNAFEVWANGGTAAQAEEAFLTAYRPYCENEAKVPPDDRLHWMNVLVVLRRWLREHPLATAGIEGGSFPVLPVGAELRVWEELGQTRRGTTVTLLGRMDILGLGYMRDRYWVVDHKTTGDRLRSEKIQQNWIGKWKLAPSITGYIWAGMQQLDMPVAGAMLNGVELPWVPTSGKECPDHKLPYLECGPWHATFVVATTYRTPAAINAWQATMLSIAEKLEGLQEFIGERGVDGVADLPQEGLYVYGACQGCEFRTFCEADRPTGAIDSYAKHEPWEPYPLVEGRPPRLQEQVVARQVAAALVV